MAAKEAAKSEKKEKRGKGERAEKERMEQQTGPIKFAIGDNVKVHVRIYEGDKERIQSFAGTVIARKGREDTEMFTVRRISHGVGVERIFPVHSPHIARVEVESSTHVRRAKLYFLRRMSGKSARLEEKIGGESASSAAPAPAPVPPPEQKPK
jgi:large subunit ribosomal protein L19